MNRAAILRGALAGLGLIVPLVAVQVIVTLVSEDDVSGGLVAVLFLGILLAFGVAGSRAGRRVPSDARRHGALAALAALIVWIPFRLALAAGGDDGNPLAGIGAAAAFALVLGGLGGLWGARRARQ
ncbi:MAG: hypothetical protein HYU28_05020 [Actinobacteria bacterium]|nr:hypothetical protein [Actinomycetota bacterium]